MIEAARNAGNLRHSCSRSIKSCTGSTASRRILEHENVCRAGESAQRLERLQSPLNDKRQSAGTRWRSIGEQGHQPRLAQALLPASMSIGEAAPAEASAPAALSLSLSVEGRIAAPFNNSIDPSPGTWIGVRVIPIRAEFARCVRFQLLPHFEARVACWCVLQRRAAHFARRGDPLPKANSSKVSATNKQECNKSEARPQARRANSALAGDEREQSKERAPERGQRHCSGKAELCHPASRHRELSES